ncbi:unnamed protein product [Effrenium voratum]|nr:unnamed protein product [Effrenium voratum]
MRSAVALRHEALHLLLLGVTLGLPVTQLPQLQQATFHQPFLVAGFLVSIKGVLNTLLAPALGALVDKGGHFKFWLVLSLAIPCAPFLAILTQGEPGAQVWAFSLVDTFLGLSGPAMSLCFAVVPARTPERLTEGYSLLNFALSSGVGVGAACGAAVSLSGLGCVGLALGSLNALLALLNSPPRCSTSLPALEVLKESSTLKLLALVVFLDFLAEQMLVSLLLLYLESRFHLSPWQLACELGLVGASASVSLLALVPRLQPRLGDLALMRLGMVANCVSVALFGIIWAPWQALLPPLGCFLAFAVFPTANALAAAAAPQSGALAQGVISGARTLAEGLAPVLFGGLFQVAARSAWPGWPFFVAAGCVALGTAISWQLPESRDNLLPSHGMHPVHAMHGMRVASRRWRVGTRPARHFRVHLVLPEAVAALVRKRRSR